jgi:N-acetylhexosamine 1-kinase
MDAMKGPGRGEAPWEVIGAFRFDGATIGSKPLSGGHIHRNFLVTCTGGRYILQRLNHHVFPDLGTLLSNVERLVAHLEARGRRGLRLVKTRDGALCLRAADGTTWRAFHYLEGTVGRDNPTGPADAFEAARAFADYVSDVADLPGAPLAATIQGFHDLPGRLDSLAAAAAADLVGRRGAVGHDVDRARRLGQEVAEAIETDGGAGSPVRIVHNDAKLSNVRFDATTGCATCVVDLDTTMAGRVRFDVGEVVRSAATHAPEDARDVAEVDYDLAMVEALSEGYLGSDLGLDRSEVDTLAWAGPEMAVENALRFLADHLAGDRYFAIERPAQNLDRCRAQLRLTELMLESHAETSACFARAARHAPTAERSVTERSEGIP